MIIATISRYIARRNAVQTIYWRTIEDESGVRMVKHSKLCVLKGKPNADWVETANKSIVHA